jgi:hypothetical protein
MRRAPGIDKGQLRALIHKFLTEVCHHVGDAWYQIGGTGRGVLGLLFRAQDEATFARDAFMKTNPLVKQALLQANERTARRTAEQGRRDKMPSPMIGSPQPVVRPTAMHGPSQITSMADEHKRWLLVENADGGAIFARNSLIQSQTLRIQLNAIDLSFM